MKQQVFQQAGFIEIMPIVHHMFSLYNRTHQTRKKTSAMFWQLAKQSEKKKEKKKKTQYPVALSKASKQCSMSVQRGIMHKHDVRVVPGVELQAVHLLANKAILSAPWRNHWTL